MSDEWNEMGTNDQARFGHGGRRRKSRIARCPGGVSIRPQDGLRGLEKVEQ